MECPTGADQDSGLRINTWENIMRTAIILFCVIAALITMSAPAISQVEEEAESYREYVFAESMSAFSASSKESRTRFVPSVATFGSGGVAYYTLPSLTSLSWQLGIGIYAMNDIPDRYYRGTLVDQTALALPLYTGFKYDLYRTNSRSIDMVFFTSLIGGPVIGMQMPVSDRSRPDFSATQFNWGAGAQSTLGIEFMFSENWAGYLQGGVDIIGFSRKLGDKATYFGPVVGLGVGRVIGR
jgi:hypothetical protein